MAPDLPVTAAPRDNQFALFTIKTSDDWTLSDVRRFVDVVDRLYGWFLVVRMAEQRVDASSQGSGWRTSTLGDYVLGLGSQRQAPDQTWDPETRRRLVAVSPADLPFGPEVRYLQYLHEHRHLLAPDAELRVDSWRMASPGTITLLGIDKCIREMRELLKDLTFRNKQERQLGDLEIARQRLALEKEIFSPGTVDYIAVQTLEGARNYQALEAGGKVRSRSETAWLIEDVIARVPVLVPQTADAQRIVAQLERMRRTERSKPSEFRDSFERLRTDLRKLQSRGDITLESYQELDEAARRIYALRRSSA